MAQMYPASLTSDDFHDSRGEHKLYDALADQLSGEWDVYHSISWLQRTGERGAWEGEVDFVLAHPREGILCVEVKGGGVRLMGGRWHRKDGESWVAYDRDPFVQAQDEHHALERLIAELSGWKHKKLLIGHAVSFPEVSIVDDPLPPSAPREIIVDRHDVGRLEEVVLGALGRFRTGKEPPGEAGMEMLRERLVPTLEIEVPLAERFLEEEEILVKLTHEQTMMLRRFGHNRRLAVRGCAGSGKTMLAVEQAKWLKREKGLDVAFVCFNSALAKHLKEKERHSGIEFTTFHGLCTKVAYQAKLDVPQFEGDPPQDYWDTTLPELLVDAVDELGGLFDALMIDEAQDLHNHWLTALMATLRDERDAWVWLFMDSNQRVYEADLEVPPEFFLYDLNVNCRNTQLIHREVMKKYVGEVTPEALGPEGRTPELHQTDDQPETVAGVIERLCGREEVLPQDIVVLSSHGFDNSEVAQSRPGRFRFTKERGKLGDHICFSSIRGFKGLESKVVILCELQDISDATQGRQIYTGMSRARNHCVIVAPNAPG